MATQPTRAVARWWTDNPLRSIAVGLVARPTRQLRQADFALQPNRFRVVDARSAEEREEVFRLRHRIYVDLMKVFDAADPRVAGGTLRDGFDEYSTLLLLRYDERPVGTMRVTFTSDGPLELESYRSLAPYRHPGGIAFEIQRVMVLPEFRCVAATHALLSRAVRLALERGATQLFGAARIGNLGQGFQNIGARIVDPLPFRFTFLPNAEYQLICNDLGRPGSLRRWVIVASLAAWGRLARHSPGLAVRIGRRHAPPAPG